MASLIQAFSAVTLLLISPPQNATPLAPFEQLFQVTRPLAQGKLKQRILHDGVGRVGILELWRSELICATVVPLVVGETKVGVFSIVALYWATSSSSVLTSLPVWSNRISVELA